MFPILRLMEESDNEVEGMDVEREKSDEEATYVEDQSNERTLLTLQAPTNRPPTQLLSSFITKQPPIPDKLPRLLPQALTAKSPDFGSLFGFDNRLKALEDNFSEFKQTNQYAEALSSIPGIVDQYLANKMKEAVDVAVQLKSDRIREEAQAENQQFLDLIDEGMKKVTRNKSREAKTSHAVAANLSELELKKILIDKMEANKSINRSDVQRQLYKALVDANLARRQDPRESFDELTDTTFDFSAFVMNRLNVTTLTPELLAGPTFELMKGTCKSLTELEYFCEEVYKATTEKLDWINPEGRQYPHDLRKPLPLVPNSQGRHVIPFHHFINNDLEYLRGGESSRKYSTSITKTKAADNGHIKRDR
ncbi:hypothetical protein Tco_0676339 [Tanacetum coccineum]